jgi:hypothetical protein
VVEYPPEPFFYSLEAQKEGALYEEREGGSIVLEQRRVGTVRSARQCSSRPFAAALLSRAPPWLRRAGHSHVSRAHASAPVSPVPPLRRTSPGRQPSRPGRRTAP